MKFAEFKLALRTDLSIVRHQLSPDSDLLPPDFRCLTESLEIRLSDPFDGSFFCSDDMDGKVLVSDSGNVTIMLHNFSKSTSTRQLQERRLKIAVDFVDRTPVTTPLSTVTATTPTTSPSSIFPPFRPSVTTTPRPAILSLLSIPQAILDNVLLNTLREFTTKIVGTMIKLIPAG